MSPTLNVNPTLFVIPCEICWGLILSLTKRFFIQISTIHELDTQVANKREEVGFWPMDELIHHP